MVEKSRRFASIFPWILSGGALLFALSLSRSYVGFYYDDADYILTALAFVRGQFTSPRLPGLPLLRSHWPGFSMLLTPFVAIVQPHWALLKVVPFLSVLTCAVLVGAWWRRRFSTGVALGLSALFILNPSTAERAGAVMSEPAFLLLILAILFVLENRPAGRSRGWMLGALAAAASLVRPEGILLTAALVSAIYLWGNGQEALEAGVPTAVLMGLYLLLRSVGKLPLSGYWSDWLRNAPVIDMTVRLQQAGLQLLTLFAGMIFNLPIPQSRLMWAAGMLLTIIATSLCVYGARVLWKDRSHRAETATLLFFTVAYFIFHVFWPVVDQRFLWPLLPIVLYLGVSALGPLEIAGQARVQALAVISGILLMSYVGSTLHAIKASTPLNRLPTTSLEWLKANGSSTEKILTNNPSMVYLYTGRPAIGLQAGALHDPATFFYGCNASQITTIVYFPPPPAFANLPVTDALLVRWEQSAQWVDARTYAYERVFASPTEGVLIYHVKPNPKYLQAYGLYLSAMMDFSHGNALWGRAKLKEALREDPEFPEAYTADGLCVMATGGSMAEATKSLKESQRLDPTYPPTVAALQRLTKN